MPPTPLTKGLTEVTDNPMMQVVTRERTSFAHRNTIAVAMSGRARKVQLERTPNFVNFACGGDEPC